MKKTFLAILLSVIFFGCKEGSKINPENFLIGDKWCIDYNEFCIIFLKDGLIVSNSIDGKFNSHKKKPFHITKIDYKNNIIYTQRIKSILGNLYSFKILDKDTVEFQVQGDLKSEKLYRVKL